MLSETETDAELEYRAGNFGEACELYGKMLLQLDSSAKLERIELLKKLGASQQRAALYQESLNTYETLLELQDQNGIRDAEKIVTYLKLAKAHDQCSQQPQAEIEFRIAHKLATSLLPLQHVIRKSVIASYATWLIKTDGDKSVLRNLKQEMKEALGSENGEADKEVTLAPSTQGVLVGRSEYAKPTAEHDLEKDGLDCEFRRSAENTGSHASIPLSANKTSNDNNTGRDWSDLPIHTQPSMRGTARSYFKTQSSTELDKAIKDENSWTRRLIRFAPIAICAFVFALFVTSLVNEPSSKELPPFVQALVGKTFATTDGSMSITVGKDGLMLTGTGLKKKIRPVVWKGSFSDELRLIKGEYANYLWLTPIEHGLQDTTGLKFWDENSEETKTTRVMNIVAAGAQSFYQNNHRYPIASEAKNLFSYHNPCTNKIEAVRTYSFNTYSLDSKIKDKKLDVRMMRGESFEQEMSPEPGTVAMLSVINKPHGRVELPNQPIECQYAYLHAYDRNGQMILCPTTEVPLVLSLEKGVTQRPEDKTVTGRFSNASLAIAQGSPPSSALVLLKYIGCALLVLALAGYLVWIRVSSLKN